MSVSPAMPISPAMNFCWMYFCPASDQREQAPCSFTSIDHTCTQDKGQREQAPCSFTSIDHTCTQDKDQREQAPCSLTSIDHTCTQDKDQREQAPCSLSSIDHTCTQDKGQFLCSAAFRADRNEKGMKSERNMEGAMLSQPSVYCARTLSSSLRAFGVLCSYLKAII